MIKNSAEITVRAARRSSFDQRRKIMDARVAVIFKFCVGGDEYQVMKARRCDDQFISRISIRKIWQPHGVGYNFR